MKAVQAGWTARKLGKSFKRNLWPELHESWLNDLQKHTSKAKTNMQNKKN